MVADGALADALARAGVHGAHERDRPVARAFLTAKRQVLLSWRRARAGTDGDLLFQAVLADVEARVRLGQRCVMVWDIDNTLVDTRYRTQAAARAFAAEWKGQRPPELERLASVKIRDVGRDAAETCRNLGIVDPVVVERFRATWERFFWYGENLHYDRRIGKTAEMAWMAWWAGAENRYLTGRVDTLPDRSEGLRLPEAHPLRPGTPIIPHKGRLSPLVAAPGSESLRRGPGNQ